MLRIALAINDNKIYETLKKQNDIELVCKEILYKEAILELLEENKKIDIIIIYENLLGEISLINLLKKIKEINKLIKIIVVLEKENIETEEKIKKLKIKNIYYKNNINYKNIIKIINNISNFKIKNIQHENKSYKNNKLNYEKNKNNIKNKNDSIIENNQFNKIKNIKNYIYENKKNNLIKNKINRKNLNNKKINNNKLNNNKENNNKLNNKYKFNQIISFVINDNLNNKKNNILIAKNISKKNKEKKIAIVNFNEIKNYKLKNNTNKSNKKSYEIKKSEINKKINLIKINLFLINYLNKNKIKNIFYNIIKSLKLVNDIIIFQVNKNLNYKIKKEILFLSEKIFILTGSNFEELKHTRYILDEYNNRLKLENSEEKITLVLVNKNHINKEIVEECFKNYKVINLREIRRKDINGIIKR